MDVLRLEHAKAQQRALGLGQYSIGRADIYEYYTYKNEILKAKRKTPNRNYYIPISNIGLEENGYGMHRETKSKAWLS